MAQLDRLISVMVSNRADSIQLMENDAAKMIVQGDARPLTKAPLAAAQIVALVSEIAQPDDRAKIAAGTGTTFRYDNPDGSFGVRVRKGDSGWMVSIAVDDHGEFQRMTGSFHAMEVDDAPAAIPAAAPRASAAITAAAVSAAAVAGPAKPPSDKSPVSVWTNSIPAAVAKAEIDTLLTVLVQKGGSDLHLRVGEPPIIRLHGEMMRLEGKRPIESEMLEAMMQCIMPDRNIKEFTDTNDSDYAYEIEGVARYRCNAMRERKGVAAVFRVIPATVVTVEQMKVTQEVQNLCFLTKGLVLVTGPTGSGKSTTLCSLIDLVNRARSDHVITIEDPIEFVHPNKNCIITQRQVGVHTASFKSALRAALREDPDVILVGELRDLETTAIAIETAETGHLVFGTLHTTTAAGTVDRIIDQFPADRQDQIRTMLSESLKGVVAQVLCKKIGGGRVAAREIMLGAPSVSNLIREGKTFQLPSVIQTSRRVGMNLLNDALLDYVNDKVVEPKEAYMKSVEKVGMANMLKQHGHDTSFLEGDMSTEGAPPKEPEKPRPPPRPPLKR